VEDGGFLFCILMSTLIESQNNWALLMYAQLIVSHSKEITYTEFIVSHSNGNNICKLDCFTRDLIGNK